jgi:hypothetical protein
MSLFESIMISADFTSLVQDHLETKKIFNRAKKAGNLKMYRITKNALAKQEAMIADMLVAGITVAEA